MYSIVIPALFLTLVLDFIGIQLNPDIYYNGPWGYAEGYQITEYLLTFFLIQNIWDWGLNPGINQPFWSLTFEWFYYIIFAIFYLLNQI